MTDEIRQLPVDNPGIVEIWNGNNLLFVLNDIYSIIDAVTAEIARHPHIFAVALKINYGWAIPETKYAPIGEHLFIVDTGRDSISRHCLLVINKSFNLPISDSTRDKLLNAFLLARSDDN